MTGGDCGSDHCITCSDEAVPMRVLGLATDAIAHCVSDDGAESDVMTDLVPNLGPGDRVLVHAGVALSRVPEAPQEVRG